MGYWERQLSRQAEHSSFHLRFLPSQMFKGVHKQLRILKVETLKQRENHQKCVWGGPNMLVKEGCEAQKWKCENFTSVSVFIPAWGAAALIPGIPKAHTISSPHSVPPPASSQFTPSPFFPLLSTAAPAISAAQEEQFYFHIALGTSSKAASLPVGTVGDILCECEAVCVYREQKRAQFAF